jgi:hypothetical protein
LIRSAPPLALLEKTPFHTPQHNFGPQDDVVPGGLFDARNDFTFKRLGKKPKNLCFSVGATEWHVDLDLQAVVEQVCVDVGPERIFYDIDEWNSVPADDLAHALLVTEPDGSIGYENKTVLLPAGEWVDRENVQDCHSEEQQTGPQVRPASAELPAAKNQGSGVIIPFFPVVLGTHSGAYGSSTDHVTIYRVSM